MKPELFYSKKRMIFFISISIAIMSILTAIKLYSSYHFIGKSAEITLAKQYTEIADEIIDGLDKAAYKQLLMNKQDDEHRHNLKLYLEGYRNRVNALYVYVLMLDESNVSKVMVTAALPNTKDIAIGTPCTVPPEQVRMAKKGKNYFTDVIHDVETGSYMSIGVPFLDENGKVIGVLGIDISAKDLGYIIKKVVIKNKIVFGMDLIFAILLLTGVYMLNRWYKARLKWDLQESEKMYISELGKIVDTIKSSRHDLMNHLQVLNGLMDIQRYDKAHQYLKQLTEESVTLSLSLHIKNPILMVIIQGKREVAHSKNIRINVHNDYDSYERIESMDIVKIFSNLIDNAIEATESLAYETQQIVNVRCVVEDGKYIFTIENPAVLTEEQQKNFFKSGFTTKSDGSNLHGNGLSIVKRTVDKYKGEMHFQYKDGKVLIVMKI